MAGRADAVVLLHAFIHFGDVAFVEGHRDVGFSDERGEEPTNAIHNVGEFVFGGLLYKFN